MVDCLVKLKGHRNIHAGDVSYQSISYINIHIKIYKETTKNKSINKCNNIVYIYIYIGLAIITHRIPKRPWGPIQQGTPAKVPKKTAWTSMSKSARNGPSGRMAKHKALELTQHLAKLCQIVLNNEMGKLYKTQHLR